MAPAVINQARPKISELKSLIKQLRISRGGQNFIFLVSLLFIPLDFILSVKQPTQRSLMKRNETERNELYIQCEKERNGAGRIALKRNEPWMLFLSF